MDATKQVARSIETSTKVAQLYGKRTKFAQQHFSERLSKAYAECAAGLAGNPVTPLDAWSKWTEYATDFAQRSILFLDTLRERGNNFVEHSRAGLPPVLHFDYEMEVDGRKLGRPVNYALLRIIPPEGVKVDPRRRPYVIIDPRAGHGPGIGGFKDDSQVGVALREGHPVYFVIFFRDPEPGQTLLDVCEAEQQFVKRVRELHPASPKPVIVGNCQGGWAAMMLAASDPRGHRPDRDQRRADVVLGRRVPGARRRQPDALRRRPAGRHLARVADRRPGRRHLRRRLPGRELREQQPRQHLLGQVLQPVHADRHRAPALPRVRALVGRLLPDEPRGDRVDHAEPLRRQQAVVRHRGNGRQGVRPARHQGTDRRLRVDGRQHHPAAAGVQLGGRHLRLDRRNQGARTGDRRAPAPGRRPPRDLRLRQGGEEGARADRLGAEVDRGAAAGPVRHEDPRSAGPGRQGRATRSSSSSAGWRTSSRG